MEICSEGFRTAEEAVLALHEYPFWYADYEQLPQTPYAFDIWQYSNEGHVDGIDGAVDLDLMFVKK